MGELGAEIGAELGAPETLDELLEISFGHSLQICRVDDGDWMLVRGRGRNGGGDCRRGQKGRLGSSFTWGFA